MKTHLEQAKRETPKGGVQQGFMLLEVLVSILLFALGIVALVGLRGQSLATTGDVQYRAEAIHLARAYEAKIRATNLANINSGLFVSGGAEFAIFSDQVRGNNGFPGLPGATLIVNNPRVTITPGNAMAPAITDPHVNSVQIQISWQAPGDTGSHMYIQDSVIWNP
jgi:type IV pilus assembly protein PilV